MIAGRERESMLLMEAYESELAEFIVLYGRRRIGKTYLIEQLYGNQQAHFFHVTGIKDAPMKEQLTEFTECVGKTFYSGARIARQATWLEAFKELTTAIENVQSTHKKVILFLDELPWLCTKRSRLIQAIDYYWNRYWKNNARVKLVICGSSASWIINKIINNKGGLHNRYTCQLLLKPFTLSETEQFLTKKKVTLSQQQIVDIYVVTGGVPYYLNYIKRGVSAAQIIDRLCFQKEGILYNEFDKLFASLFENAALYIDIIRAIAQQRHGMSLVEIEKHCNSISSGGTLTNKLKELEDAAFIKEFVPLGHRRQGKYYRVIDEYCYFYLQWIEPLKKELTIDYDDNQIWMTYVGTPKYYNWQGYAFESLCYKHINSIRHALNIHQGVSIGAWRYTPTKLENKQGAQIDLLFDRKDGVVTLCEIKYSGKPFVIDKLYAENLENKCAVYQEQTRTKKHLSIVFVTVNGLKANSYSEKLVDKFISLDTFFKQIN